MHSAKSFSLSRRERNANFVDIRSVKIKRYMIFTINTDTQEKKKKEATNMRHEYARRRV